MKLTHNKASLIFRYGLPALVVLMGVGMYLGLVGWQGSLGFPLDDAWIHQTYARNLVRNGRWEFVSGVVSAGSTSPLWTLLLALGYLFRIPYLWWAYLWGTISLFLLCWGGMRFWRLLWPDKAEKDWMAGLILAGTWPFIWAAVSGMETIFFAALGLTILSIYAAAMVMDEWVSIKWLGLLGVLCGLLILTRPDGLVLFMLVVLGVMLLPGSQMQRMKYGGVVVGTAVFILVPYFGFNLFTSGNIWPNTFYAKQTEYAALLSVPLMTRLIQMLTFSVGGPASGWRGMSGAHLLLVPGLLVAGWQAVKIDWSRKKVVATLPLLWAGSHIFLYAWRLPLTFQHGRYLLAAFPVWILYGLAGWQHVLFFRSPSRPMWIVQQVSRWTFAGLLAFFVLLGARAYADDVAFIEGEMVTMAGWIAENTSETAVIASHDIGAIGYFAERPLLDLAGLISPDIIPLLDNESAMVDYILNSQAQYLVSAPGWPYETAVTTGQMQRLFSTNYTWTVENGRNNMTIYLLKRS